MQEYAIRHSEYITMCEMPGKNFSANEASEISLNYTLTNVDTRQR